MLPFARTQKERLLPLNSNVGPLKSVKMLPSTVCYWIQTSSKCWASSKVNTSLQNDSFQNSSGRVGMGRRGPCPCVPLCCPSAIPQHTDAEIETKQSRRIDTDKVCRISQIRNFKEFYWNKDKFQSQSLIIFEKRTVWLCANIFWLFFKALFCLFSILYIRREIKGGRGGRKKPYTIGRFGTINSYNSSPVLVTYRHFTLHRSDRCLLDYFFTMGFLTPWQSWNTVVMESEKKMTFNFTLRPLPSKPQSLCVDLCWPWCSVCIGRVIWSSLAMASHNPRPRRASLTPFTLRVFPLGGRGRK